MTLIRHIGRWASIKWYFTDALSRRIPSLFYNVSVFPKDPLLTFKGGQAGLDLGADTGAPEGFRAISVSTLGPGTKHRLVDAKVGGSLAEAHPGSSGQGDGLGLELLGVGLPDLGLGLVVGGGSGLDGHPMSGFPLIRRSSKPGEDHCDSGRAKIFGGELRRIVRYSSDVTGG